MPLSRVPESIRDDGHACGSRDTRGVSLPMFRNDGENKIPPFAIAITSNCEIPGWKIYKNNNIDNYQLLIKNTILLIFLNHSAIVLIV
jgi:hypothetical protein